MRASLAAMGAGALGMAALMGPLSAQTVYQTGFEATEGYELANASGQNGWVTEFGAADVVGGPVYSGAAAMQLWPGSSIFREGSVASGMVVFRAQVLQAMSQAPELPRYGQAVVLYLDAAKGLTALDGDGRGGGRWVGSGAFAGPDDWLGLEVELDFATKTFGCRLNGRPVLWGLGFADNNVMALATVRFGTNLPEGNDTGRGVVVDDVGWSMRPAPSPGGVGVIAPTSLGTGFEVEEGYATGDLDGQQGWSVVSGMGEVWTQLVQSGKQAVRVSGAGTVTRWMAPESGRVEFRSWVQATPTDQPDLPATGQAVVLYMDQAHGLTGLDGTGQGGGTWVSSGIQVPAGEWFDLLVRVDITAKTWDVFVNGRPALVRLGFHSDAVASLGEVQVASGPKASDQALLDQLSVRPAPQPFDCNDTTPPWVLGGAMPAGTGFEPPEGFALGDLDCQLGWTVETGVAEVWGQTVASGRQSVRIGPSGMARRSVAGVAGVVTMEALLQAVPCSMPPLPESARLAALYLDPVTGITGLSGDGQGGGRWVGSGFTVTAGSWFRARVSLDFTTGKWDCSVDGRPVLSGLDLHSRDVASLTWLALGASPDGVTLVDDLVLRGEDPVRVAPTLSVSWTPTGLEIAWPVADGAGYRLQATDALGVGWMDVPTTGNRWVEAIGQEARFFRLAAP